MNGITVVNTIETTKIAGEYWGYNGGIGSILGIIGLCILTGTICFLFYVMITEEEGSYFFIILVLIIFIGIIITATFHHEIEEPVLQKQIVVDDTIKLNEFFSKYNVIDRQGLIFTIEEPIQKDEVK